MATPSWSWVLAGCLWLAPSALAKAPAGQGRACNAGTSCDGKLQCVAHPDRKSTCELTCATNRDCPEDQRCVKDGSQRLCRPIDDGLGL